MLVTLTSTANHQRMDQIRADARRVADPRGAAQTELDAAAARAACHRLARVHGAWPGSVGRRGGDRDAVPAGGRSGRADTADARQHGRADRSRAEPGRSRASRAGCHAHAVGVGRADASIGDDPFRHVAGAAHEPLLLRPEPRLVCAVASGDARSRAVNARVVAARGGGPARDGIQLDILLSARDGADQPARTSEHSGLVGHLRGRHHRCVRS
jgi:hypothetical protein